MKINKRIKDAKLSIASITELAQKTPGCIRFDIGQPDFDTPLHIKEAIKRALKDGKTGYAPLLGIPELRQAIAEYECAKGIYVNEKNVAVTNGGLNAIFDVFLTMLEPGDEVILPNPNWCIYELMLTSLNISFKPVAYIRNSELDEVALLDAINERTRMILVNSPSNPTGEVLDSKTLERIASIVKEHGLVALSDEVYDRILFDGITAPSIRQYVPEDTIIINSTSKTYAMTGSRVGWLVAPEEVVNELKKGIRATTGCVNTYAQYGALAALRSDQYCVEEMRQEYEKRLNAMKERISHMGWKCPDVNGAFYMFPDTGKDSWTYAVDLIKIAGVSPIHGEAFGSEGKTSLRFCFGSANIEHINQGFDRIETHEKVRYQKI